jgi:hypothetical protein
VPGERYVAENEKAPQSWKQEVLGPRSHTPARALHTGRTVGKIASCCCQMGCSWQRCLFPSRFHPPRSDLISTEGSPVSPVTLVLFKTGVGAKKRESPGRPRRSRVGRICRE